MVRIGALGAAIVIGVCVSSAVAARIDRAPHYQERLDRFQSQPVQSDDIVMLGDSLIAQGRWSDWLDSSDIRNFGIGGDTTAAMLRRLDMVTRAEPRVIVLQIGTNDLRGGADPARIIENYERILARIRAESPSSLVVVLSLPPKNARNANAVWTINQAQRRLAHHYGGVFVDLFEPLRDRYGAMERRYTTDFVHFSRRGYHVVIDELEDALRMVASRRN